MAVNEELKVKPTVLLADDSDISRTFTKMMLRKTYEVVEARTGQEVIDLLHRGDVDYRLLLLDLHMPVVDGWGVLDFLRKMDLLSVLPVVVVSAMAVEPETLVRCYESGAWSIVSKPFSEKVMLAQVNSFVARVEGVKRAVLKSRSNDDGNAVVRLISDASANGIFAENPVSHVITYANARFIELVGGAPVVGRSVADVVSERIATVFSMAAQNALEGRPSAVTLSLSPKTYHSLAYSYIEDRTGKPVLLVGTITNLTGIVKRVRELEALKS